jgi:hypothetical protein
VNRRFLPENAACTISNIRRSRVTKPRRPPFAYAPIELTRSWRRSSNVFGRERVLRLSEGFSKGERVALDSIAADLAAERRARKRRALGAGLVTFAIVMLFAIKAPVDPTSSTRLLMIAAAFLVLLIWLAMSFSTAIQMPLIAAHAISLAAVCLPLMAAPKHAVGPEPAHAKFAALAFRCMGHSMLHFAAHSASAAVLIIAVRLLTKPAQVSHVHTPS